MGLAIELQASRGQAVARGNAARGIFAARAENAELWGADGMRYIYFAASLTVPADQLDEPLDIPDASIGAAINVKGA